MIKYGPEMVAVDQWNLIDLKKEMLVDFGELVLKLDLIILHDAQRHERIDFVISKN